MNTKISAIVAVLVKCSDAYWWNQEPRPISGYEGSNNHAQASTNAYQYSPKFYGRFQGFKNPIGANMLQKDLAAQDAHEEKYIPQRPSTGPIDHKTEKVKVRMTIQYNCKYLPSITSVQNALNDDYTILQLLRKKISAVHIQRFSCHTPTELWADFDFYVYEDTLATFDNQILNGLKPSLSRAVGVHHTESAKTVRVLTEEELVAEAVDQVSISISQAIEEVGAKANISNIVDMAVDSIVNLDGLSVNNILNDLVSVITSDGDQIVSELVHKVENQINSDSSSKNISPEKIHQVAETISKETTDIISNLPNSNPSLEVYTDSAIIESANEGLYISANPDEITEQESQDFADDVARETGDLEDFLKGLKGEEVIDVMDKVIEESDIQGEETLNESDDAVSEENIENVSAKDIMDNILPEYVAESSSDHESNNNNDEKSPDLLMEIYAEEEAKNEFREALLNTQVDEEPLEEVPFVTSPVVDQILAISENSIKDEMDSVQVKETELLENDVVSLIKEVSEEDSNDSDSEEYANEVIEAINYSQLEEDYEDSESEEKVTDDVPNDTSINEVVATENSDVVTIQSSNNTTALLQNNTVSVDSTQSVIDLTNPIINNDLINSGNSTKIDQNVVTDEVKDQLLNVINKTNTTVPIVTDVVDSIKEAVNTDLVLDDQVIDQLMIDSEFTNGTVGETGGEMNHTLMDSVVETVLSLFSR